ncbi:unnamed protein product [Aspergillus oryzae RIB40]|uniref:DNA, SC020 n=2 Tax=Aspergillus oryzae TaxID=5062 RepID=Q2U4Y9_ASPOR|nr:unnamed protein product [Aspergillus oryzae RIB40]EIT77922.1 hypothetical protein Ao3042_05862 [Aspergillus oryzae 3.042]KDE83930.1 hypothetical protein AO1008_10556 [Aspergillus oryzae 100-8]BAE63376.1 unnamed protein product [Aspergillus oryzae RIB40]|eukprot:EIT77922.1 hypothetical protein Ao3042_05862 [Aspergillus oryzae 3.042]
MASPGSKGSCQVVCRVGPDFQRYPELGVTNHYQPDRTRYPIVNYPHAAVELTGVYKTFQAIANDTNAYEEGAAKVSRLLLGQKYPLLIHWENDIYGVRKTTTQDHYADDDILYAGKDKPPKIMIMLETVDKKYKKKHIGSGCKVVPWIYDNEGRSLGNLVDHHHSIRTHDLGDYEPPPLDIRHVRLEEKVTCFMDGKKLQIEYFNDTLERHDPATVFAHTDDKENQPFKHFVFTNI